MDFAWVNGTNPRKPLSYTSDNVTPATQSTEATHRFAPAQSLRRHRADTMPSQPCLNYGYSPSPSGLSTGVRHRSGSVTFPAEVGLFSTPGTDEVTSPMDENASNTIASTLASLGLNEDTDDHGTHDTPAVTTAATASYFPSDEPTRHRSYTFAGRNPLDRPDLNHLLGFSPFSPQTRSAVQHRPRAISVGMADNAQFMPFEPIMSKLSHPAETSSMLRASRSSSNLFDLGKELYQPRTMSRLHEQLDDFAEQTVKPQTTEESPSSSPAQVPSRALWLGNVNPSVSVPDLIKLFSCYGHVESARILSDKECAFVNFLTVESAVAAKNDFETRLGSRLNGTVVRVGFGKADVNVAMALTNEAGPNAQGPTRALWIGNIPANISPLALRSLFQPFGSIESVRVLSHKNCGFVNFYNQEDAVRARKALQNKEVLGPGTGTVRIGFAKVPTASTEDQDDVSGISPSSITTASPDTYQATQWATAMMMTSMLMDTPGQSPSASGFQPTNLHTAIASERLYIMNQLGYDGPESVKDRVPLAYASSIPLLPELGADRKVEVLRLREIRRALDNNQGLDRVEDIAAECMDDIIELCSDYIGNTVVQKLFEFCSESTKETMLKKIAPFLAAIGIHKNGTWAAQKIIDYANTSVQADLVCTHVAPYVPLLLLDQFGNYVVQCCLQMDHKRNQYIFDAIVDKCWEIGQGRFGARAVRAILENTAVLKEQKIYVAAAIVQNAVLLATNANGSLLLTWLLDVSELSGRFRVLCPRLLPYLSKLAIHKFGSMVIYKIIQQNEEPDASNLLQNAIFNDPGVLDDILKDQVYGVSLIQRILTVADDRSKLASKVMESLTRLKVEHHSGYKKLLDELDTVHASSNEAKDSESTDETPWLQNPQTVAMMANMYAAAMTAAAAANIQQPSGVTPDLSQLEQLMKNLINTKKDNQEPEKK
ncbi:uncharacterized protein BYT42DRAFT_610120 [Radiomyces spectabilis]|uniref:uncharacterized protein n=1 Tax=Radiomyces spectabilis TaxID=64574 RepID=UPI00221E5531|nr:uncharacterized protein BYT42DRAFT_610120 [Radiomyces spectabilis]KAI8390844.1 hypothetical protein BYT42DRAFT_610120 [Radiomyces spectabilis]